MPKKNQNANQSFGLIVVAYVKRHELNFFSCNLFFSNGFDTFSFFMRAFIKKAESDFKIITARRRLRAT